MPHFKLLIKFNNLIINLELVNIKKFLEKLLALQTFLKKFFTKIKPSLTRFYLLLIKRMKFQRVIKEVYFLFLHDFEIFFLEFELIASKDYGVCELFFQQLIKSLWLIGDKENALYYFNRLKKNKIFWKVFSAWDYIINYVAQSGNLSGALVLINEHSDQEWKRRALVSIAKLKIRVTFFFKSIS